jgi:hypothetical protein
MCCRRSLLFFALLGLGVLGFTLRAEEAANAKAAAEKLAADLAAGKKISEADAKAFAKKYDDLEDVMEVFKAPKRGQPTLESTLGKLAAKKSGYSDADKKTMIKIANLARALALVTPHYDSKTKGSRDKKREWDKYTKEMGEGAKELLEAIKAGKPAPIADKATKLSGSCTDCHGAFR